MSKVTVAKFRPSVAHANPTNVTRMLRALPRLVASLAKLDLLD
jgi:hypothetical protein